MIKEKTLALFFLIRKIFPFNPRCRDETVPDDRNHKERRRVATTKSRWWVVFSAVAAAMAPVLHATVLDVFDSTAGWVVKDNAEGSTVDLSTVPGQSGNALQVDYNFFTGQTIRLSKESFIDSINMNQGSANALTFTYRAEGDANTVELKFVDGDNSETILADNLVYKFPPEVDNVWRTITVPLTDFFTNDFGNYSFNRAVVKKFGFGFSRDVDGLPARGSLYLDDVWLTKVSAPRALIDSAEGSNPLINDRAGPQSLYFGANGGATGSLSVSAVAHSGSKSRDFQCTWDPGGYCYAAEALGGMSAQGDETLEFWVRGTVGNEPLKIQVKSTTTVSVTQNVVGISSTAFKKHSFTLASFKSINPNLDLAHLAEVVFVFDTVGTHRILIDDVAIVGPSGSSGDIQKVEDFSNFTPYSYIVAAPTATATVELLGGLDFTVPGHTGGTTATRLDYTFTSAPGLAFSVAEKRFASNLTEEPTVRFRYKGTGADSNIEVHLQDSDGTVFRKVLYAASNTEGIWKTASIPVDQFSFHSIGEDASLQLSYIPKIHFVLTRNGGAEGTLTIDTLETVPSRDLEKTSIGSVLTSVVTPDNPFTPNHDGTTDAFRIEVTLSQAAQVRYKVFNLQGVPIFTPEFVDLAQGTTTLVWYGQNNEGTLLANGVYFFMLEAESSFSGKEVFRQVVGIAR